MEADDVSRGDEGLCQETPHVPVLEGKCEKGSGLQSIRASNGHVLRTCTEEASQR